MREVGTLEFYKVINAAPHQRNLERDKMPWRVVYFDSVGKVLGVKYIGDYWAASSERYYLSEDE